jgi:UDPglucose 6-dehydrogenase
VVELAVIGAGYVGAVTAVCLADRGHDVSLVEIAANRLASYESGRVPFFEPGLEELFRAVRAAGRLRVTGDGTSAVASCDLVLVCVGTPLSSQGEPDLSQVEAACRTIGDSASNPIVVIRSTLPMGATPSLAEWLGRTSLDGVVTNPEFLAQGSAVRDFQAPTRIVIGTEDGRPSVASARVDELYGGVDAPRIVTDFASAEMIKNVANGFLAMKLSFINEVADLCEAYGADVEAVVRGIGLDPRIGSSYLRPGIGFGGSCLPKELANLVRLGQSRGLPMRMFGAAGAANDGRAGSIAERLERVFGPLEGRRVAMLGLAFKADTDDTRYSPAVGLARELLARGAQVVAHDPAVPVAISDQISGLQRAGTVDEAFDGADLAILATEWREYRELDWARLAGVVRSRILFDGRNALDAASLRSAGWWVVRIGAAMSAPEVQGAAEPA